MAWFRRAILATLVVICSAPRGHATTLELLGTRAGLKHDTGWGFPDAYLTGRQTSSVASPTTTRGFIRFDLGGVSTPVRAAQVRTIRGTAISPDPFETVEVYEVTTPSEELVPLTPNVAAYEDLGSGVIYGASSDFAAGAPANEIITIDLNAAAIERINASLGDEFTVGLSLASINPNSLTSELVFLGTLPNIPVLRLTLVPEPCGSGLALVALLFYGLAPRRFADAASRA
jgi:hypothetical protein